MGKLWVYYRHVLVEQPDYDWVKISIIWLATPWSFIQSDFMKNKPVVQRKRTSFFSTAKWSTQKLNSDVYMEAFEPKWANPDDI